VENHRLTDAEYFVLDDAADDFGAFTRIAWLGSGERQPLRAAEVVDALLNRSLLEIEEIAQEDWVRWFAERL